MRLWPAEQRKEPDLVGGLMERGNDLHPISSSTLLHLPSMDFSTSPTALPDVIWEYFGDLERSGHSHGLSFLQSTLHKGSDWEGRVLDLLLPSQSHKSPCLREVLGVSGRWAQQRSLTRSHQQDLYHTLILDYDPETPQCHTDKGQGFSLCEPVSF